MESLLPPGPLLEQAIVYFPFPRHFLGRGQGLDTEETFGAKLIDLFGRKLGRDHWHVCLSRSMEASAIHWEEKAMTRLSARHCKNCLTLPSEKLERRPAYLFSDGDATSPNHPDSAAPAKPARG